MTVTGPEAVADSRLRVIDALTLLGERLPESSALPGAVAESLLGALDGASGAACALEAARGSPMVEGRGRLRSVLEGLALQQLAGSALGEPLLYAPGQAPAPEGNALAVVPLGVARRSVGTLLLAWDGAADPALFDASFLAIVGRLTVDLAERVRLTDDLNARVRRSRALYRVSQALSGTLDLDRLLSLIVSLAVDTIEKASNGVLHLLDEETGELHPRALSFQPGVLPDVSGRSGMRLGVGLAGHALEDGVLVNIADVAQDRRFVEAEGARRFASMMVAPLLIGERRVGTLSVDAVDTHAFGPDDEQLLLTLATLAAAAIDNAQLISHLQESVNTLKMTQEQLVQSAKLSAVGQLISGLAHELNNPLTAIMGYVQLLRVSAELPQEARRDLAKVDEQARRAAGIVQNLLVFARQRKQEAELVDANEVLRRTLELRSYQLRRADVEIITRLDAGPLGVMAAPDQLQQVFLQLINNAQDAMRANSGPKRLIITSERTPEVVRVRVADNGPGLAPQVREHLYEPFFTTKEVGEGSGLGLSISFGIVNQYGGRIYAEEDPPEGAAFCVEFPIVREPIVGELVARGAAEPARTGRRSRILIVDDEPEVVALLEAILLEDGHRVETCTDGAEALDRVARAAAGGEPYDLLLSDIHMPGLRGPDLYSRLAESGDPLSEHLVLITGDALDPDTLAFCHAHGVTCVEKPFSLDDLMAIVDQHGGRTSAPAPDESRS